jgi:predicted HicB family RNase H-like nuclease
VADIFDHLIHALTPSADHAEETQVITIRVPASLHRALREEARQRRTSMNTLATAKLQIRATQLERLARLDADPPTPDRVPEPVYDVS